MLFWADARLRARSDPGTYFFGRNDMVGAVSWDRQFVEPIELPKGKKLITLRVAAHCFTKLPKAEHDAEESLSTTGRLGSRGPKGENSGTKRGNGHAISEAQLTSLGAATMEYRGIEYTVVQGIERGVWKWSASVSGVVISGQQPAKVEAVAAAEKAIDRALAPKKVRLVPLPRRWD
jgi:hypothetical protein